MHDMVSPSVLEVPKFFRGLAVKLQILKLCRVVFDGQFLAPSYFGLDGIEYLPQFSVVMLTLRSLASARRPL